MEGSQAVELVSRKGTRKGGGGEGRGRGKGGSGGGERKAKK